MRAGNFSHQLLLPIKRHSLIWMANQSNNCGHFFEDSYSNERKKKIAIFFTLGKLKLKYVHATSCFSDNCT